MARDLTSTYPSIAVAGRRLQADQAILDGEIVAVDANARPSFQVLQHRAAHPGHSIVFYAFDLLHLAGEDLTAAALHERRGVLDHHRQVRRAVAGTAANASGDRSVDRDYDTPGEALEGAQERL